MGARHMGLMKKWQTNLARQKTQCFGTSIPHNLENEKSHMDLMLG